MGCEVRLTGSACWIAALALAFLSFGARALPTPQADRRLNFLLIVVDDLNRWVGHLDMSAQARTPRIDALAAEGVAFSDAHVPDPLCNPSRGAVLSGLRPAETGLYDNRQDWTRAFGIEQTLPGVFKAAGYDVLGAGKIFHGSIFRPGEWTETFVPPKVDLRRHPTAPDDGIGGIRFFPVTNPASELPDSLVADWAVRQLESRRERPFLLAVGLAATHMPWAVPKEYFDRFDLAAIAVPPGSSDDLDDVPAAAITRRGLRDEERVERSGRRKEAIRAYLASMAFVDEQIGRILDALDRSPNRDDTVVVLWGDNGFHFGEKGVWRKGTLWQESTQVPFVWRVPSVTAPGGVVREPVDLMGLFATLGELAGIPVPPHVRDASLLPALRAPAEVRNSTALVTLAAGASAVVDGRYRYIRYPDGTDELYDRVADPSEEHNLADQPQHREAVAALASRLPASYAAPMPEEPRRHPVRVIGSLVLAALLAITAVIAVRRRRLRQPR